MNSQIIFSSERQNWKTPYKVYKELNQEFNFDFDPCPPDPNFNGLICDWGECNFVNPPYAHIKIWLEKALIEYKKGKNIVLLLPSRTGSAWFHECVLPYATEIRFLRGRLQFDDCGGNAPFDSIIIVYKNNNIGEIR